MRKTFGIAWKRMGSIFQTNSDTEVHRFT